MGPSFFTASSTCKTPYHRVLQQQVTCNTTLAQFPFLDRWDKQLREIIKKRFPPDRVCRENRIACLAKLNKYFNNRDIESILRWLDNNIVNLDQPTVFSVKVFCNPQVFSWLKNLAGKEKRLAKEKEEVKKYW